jgi:hypothetical protein
MTTETDTNGASKGSLLATIAVRLAATWLLIGALFKLFAGTPALLPPLVREMSPFGLDLTFHLAIAIELAVVCVALLKPRWGWPLIAATFTLFLVVLGDQQARGAASCGCLGSAVKMPPLVMMAIDGGLLAFLLATQPWRRLKSAGAPIVAVALAVVVSFAAPWLVIKSSSGDNVVTPANGDPKTPPANVRYVVLYPERWVGKSIYDIGDFAPYVGADKLPTDGRIVLWRQSCDHCAKHLRDMANEKDESQLILLVQVADDLDKGRAVDAMPSGANVTQVVLPETPSFTVETPVEIRVAGGVVTAALYEKDFEKSEQH